MKLRSKTDSLNLDDSLKLNSLNSTDTVKRYSKLDQVPKDHFVTKVPRDIKAIGYCGHLRLVTWRPL